MSRLGKTHNMSLQFTSVNQDDIFHVLPRARYSPVAPALAKRESLIGQPQALVSPLVGGWATYLKNMQPSNWIISLGSGRGKNERRLKPPPRIETTWLSPSELHQPEKS